MRWRTSIFVWCAIVAAAGVVTSCSKDNSPGVDSDTLTDSSSLPDDSDSGSQTEDTGSVTESESITPTDSGSQSDSSTQDPTDTVSETDTATSTETDTNTETEMDTEVVMSLIDVLPPAASRDVTTEVTVLGYSILVGASVRLVNCDTAAVIDVTAQATVASDGQSLVFTLAADPSRIQGLYTVEVTNPAPMAHQTDELHCAFSVLTGLPPTVTEVTPTTAFAGAAGDGVLSDTLVTIEGTGFAATPTVRWVMADGSAFFEADEVAFVNDTQLTAVVPSESAKMAVGEYNVFVTNPDKLGAKWLIDGTTAGVFTITGAAPPRIDDVQPPRVEQGSCTSEVLTVTGANFDENAEVYYMIESGLCTDQIVDANGNILCPMIVGSPTETSLTAQFAVCPGSGIWPIAVMNPDGQVDYFFSVLVTNSSAGHLNDGPFEQLSAGLETARWRHSAEYGFDAYGKAHIYVAGGQDAGGAVLDTVEMSELSVFGRPGPFATAMQYLSADDVRVTNTLTIARQGAAMVRVGRDLFVMGGATTRTDAVDVVSAEDSVERATILGYDEMPSVKSPTSAAGAGLPSGTWFYRVSALGPWGEGLATREMSLYGASGEITVCWGAPSQAGVTGYNVYRSAAADGRSGTTTLLATNVQGTCFTDDGAETLAPAPARLRGAPAAGAGLTYGDYAYVVTAIVPVGGGDPFETVASYAASVEVLQADVDAGNAALQLAWDAVPGAGVTYRVYRYDAVDEQYELLAGAPLTEATFLDAGALAVEPAVLPPASPAPLPAGSLSLWTELTEQFLLTPREGLDAVVVYLDPEDELDPVARILAVGGRGTSGTGSTASYLTSAESLAVYADGSLGEAWEAETPNLNTARAHYALVTTQNRDVTDFPPEGDEPPCPDWDGDGYLDCSCATVDALADCDDHNAAIHPEADEVCGDGIDQNCDGTGCGGSDLACACDDDLDGDGHYSTACGGDDCCDSGEEDPLGCDPTTADGIHPGAVDACDDGIDQDCNGLDPDCTCADDLDEDGHVSLACGGDDCCDSGADTSLGCTDLTDGYIYPGAAEYCEDGVDENCDGVDPRCIPTFVDLEPKRVPRVLSGDETVYIVAVMGDSDWADTNNGGLQTIEACPLDENGRLTSDGGFWHEQVETSNQPTFGHDAVLYYDFLYPFWGTNDEDYTPASARSLSNNPLRRYDVAEPDDLVAGDEDLLLEGSQSASVGFVVPRSHYQLLRLMSYIYVVGGWADAHTDLQGSPVPAGPVGELERHAQ